MNELIQLILSVHPPTLAILAVGGYAIERRMRALENRALSMETKLDLLLAGHKVVNCASDPSAGVGTTTGDPRT